MVHAASTAWIVAALLPTLVGRPNGDWSIGPVLYEYICTILPANKTILELGSGPGSGLLVKRYTVYSVEHDRFWYGMFPTNYIYAPIVDGWYDTQALAAQLPLSYDLILVDGPPGTIGRGGFYTNLALFNTNVPIIFDDTDRPAELELITLVAQKLNQPYSIIEAGHKNFGVIMPDDLVMQTIDVSSNTSESDAYSIILPEVYCD